MKYLSLSLFVLAACGSSNKSATPAKPLTWKQMDATQREQYMRDAAAMGLGDQITFTGMIDDPFGEGVFHAFAVVCQFSRWEEVFGWMIAEAMAHHTPVVSTRVDGADTFKTKLKTRRS